MKNYHTIAENPKSTVVAEYNPVYRADEGSQSEYQLEREFISQLESNGYEYINITKNEELLSNLRVQICKLNEVELSDSEWQDLLDKYLVKKNEGIEEKTAKLQEDPTFNLKRADGSTKNIRILDKKRIHNNSLQVINQYETEEDSDAKRKNRYDVTVLVNGLPMVHIELKRRGVAIREAFNQINRYQRESFWADSGLFEYIQLFVISNGTHTKYYSNTTRGAHLKEQQGKKLKKKTSNSFKFTCWWSDSKNKRISDLVDFSKTFFTQHSLLSVLCKYCVFSTDKLLLVMRPYQISAAERIINRIEMSTNHKQLGTTDAGGYIWHTTGSGKTLTSFKTAQLASQMDGVDKVLFVVDRKDLDYQTIKEYDRFEKGAANSNTSTKILTRQLENSHVNIIITTIQKLTKFVSANKGHSVFSGHIVLIFDECHRSQFGEMHKGITKAFKKYHLFGFTGTPIFGDEKSFDATSQRRSTDFVFGDKLHAYTIVDAIKDENVLPFRMDYNNTFKGKLDIEDKQVSEIDRERALKDPRRVAKVAEYIITHFNHKTNRNSDFYAFRKLSNIEEVVADRERDFRKRVEEKRDEVRLQGFNSIFAVSSIEFAKLYYLAFKEQKSGLKIATIFSFAANEDLDEGLLPDEGFETEEMDQSSRDFLDMAIKDYNQYFGTSYDTSADKFENYYKDVSQRMKNRELDMLIVVNMFLTGFDATTLNTLWVDKNLRRHGLLQAFSRTNRILNSVKSYGNIVCFRDLEQATNESLSIFGNKEAGGVVLIRSFKDYFEGYEEDGKRQKGYKDYIEELKSEFSLPLHIVGEGRERYFIRLWGAILKLRNILIPFDEFAEKELLSERGFQDYQSLYLDLYDKLRDNTDADKERINDDIVFEIELVKQVTINIEYILLLVEQYQQGNLENIELRENIDRAIDSSFELRSKKELIQKFIETLNSESNVNIEWQEFTEKNKVADLEKIIAEEKLKPALARKFMENAFKDGELRSTGTDFGDILPPMPIIDKDNARAKKKKTVFALLQKYYNKYYGV